MHGNGSPASRRRQLQRFSGPAAARQLHQRPGLGGSSGRVHERQNCSGRGAVSWLLVPARHALCASSSGLQGCKGSEPHRLRCAGPAPARHGPPGREGGAHPGRALWPARGEGGAGETCSAALRRAELPCSMTATWHSSAGRGGRKERELFTCTVCFMMGSVTSCALPAGQCRGRQQADMSSMYSSGCPAGALCSSLVGGRRRASVQRTPPLAWWMAVPTRLLWQRPPRVHTHVALLLYRLAYRVLGGAGDALSHRLHRCPHSPQHACTLRRRRLLPCRGRRQRCGRTAREPAPAPAMYPSCPFSARLRLDDAHPQAPHPRRSLKRCN